MQQPQNFFGNCPNTMLEIVSKFVSLLGTMDEQSKKKSYQFDFEHQGKTEMQRRLINWLFFMNRR